MQGNVVNVKKAHLQGADMEYVFPSGKTQLMMAAEYGFREIMQYLLQQGLSVRTVNPLNGMTALLYAVKQNQEIITKMLLDKDIGQPIQTALYTAIKQNKSSVIQALIQAAVKQYILNTPFVFQKEIKDFSRMKTVTLSETPLQTALKYNRTEIACQLIRAGALPDAFVYRDREYRENRFFMHDTPLIAAFLR